MSARGTHGPDRNSCTSFLLVSQSKVSASSKQIVTFYLIKEAPIIKNLRLKVLKMTLSRLKYVLKKTKRQESLIWFSLCLHLVGKNTFEM